MGSVIVGSAEVGLIVLTPPPGMLKLITSSPGSPAGASPDAALVLAAVIASRRVTTPSTAIVSPVLVTVIVLAEAADAAKQSRPSANTRVLRAGEKRTAGVSWLIEARTLVDGGK